LSDTFWQRWFRGVCRSHHEPDWPRLAGADWIDRIMHVEVTDRYHAKQGRSTGRWVLPDGNKRLTVYLKRHYRLPWWRGVLAALWPGVGWSPALSEKRHLEWARNQGFPVPRAVAAGEFIGPWGSLRSFLAVEELHDMLPLHEAIPAAAKQLDRSGFAAWKRGLIEEMARLARELHGRRCFHKDLYLCHFYIARADIQAAPHWRGRVHLIDLHRLGQHRWIWAIWQVKDLAQLLYSSEIDGVEARDRLRFWRLYWGGAAHSSRAGWLRFWIRRKWQRYRWHNDKRRRRANLEQRRAA